MRLVVATHDATSSSSTVGVKRDGIVYELFVSTLPSPAFTVADVLDLYLHRGSFETVLADEDDEQDSDRWYSHTPYGQEFTQILAQWIWNLRLEMGQTLSPSELCTTEFAPACEAEAPSTNEPEPAEAPTPAVIYGPPKFARPSFTHGFPGSAFTPQPDGTLRCPANHPLYPQERRPERDGSLRVLYAARIGHCRSCPQEGRGEKVYPPRHTQKNRFRLSIFMIAMVMLLLCAVLCIFFLGGTGGWVSFIVAATVIFLITVVAIDKVE